MQIGISSQDLQDVLLAKIDFNEENEQQESHRLNKS
jgi:hypothetical protein